MNKVSLRVVGKVLILASTTNHNTACEAVIFVESHNARFVPHPPNALPNIQYRERPLHSTNKRCEFAKSDNDFLFCYRV